MVEKPVSFSWVDPGRLGGMARPGSVEELRWLRGENVQLVISLTEEPVRRDWAEEAGVLVLHVPVPDMTPPTHGQFDEIVSAVRRANGQGMAVAVHCAAGMGRTGSALAAYLIAGGMPADDAVAEVRRLRPGSVETESQVKALRGYRPAVG